MNNVTVINVLIIIRRRWVIYDVSYFIMKVNYFWYWWCVFCFLITSSNALDVLLITDENCVIKGKFVEKVKSIFIALNVFIEIGSCLGWLVFGFPKEWVTFLYINEPLSLNIVVIIFELLVFWLTILDCGSGGKLCFSIWVLLV